MNNFLAGAMLALDMFTDAQAEAMAPKQVIFNDPATIVYWRDGTKTVVKCQNDEVFDSEKGLAMAFIKKFFGNTGRYNEFFKKFCKEE